MAPRAGEDLRVGDEHMTTTAVETPRAAAPIAALGRWVIPLLALAVFINYVDRGSLPTAAPLIKDELNLTGVQLGVLISAFFWTYTPGQVLAGWLGEKINPYRTLALGLAIWSIATAVMGVATGFAMILALRLLLGLGETAAFPCSSKIIAQHVPPHQLGAANTQISLGLSLGPAFGTLTGGLLMAAVGWRGSFLIFGLVSLVWLIPWWLATRHTSAAANAAPAEDESDVPSFRAIIARPELWGAGLGHFAGNYGFYFVISWLPLYLVKVQGYSITNMAKIGALVYVTYAVGAVVSGQLTDLWMRRGASANLARKTFAVGSTAAAAAALGLCAIGSPAMAVVCIFLASFALGVLSPNVFAIGQTLAGPRAAGKWVGVQNCLGNVAGIVAPLITGYLMDSAGGFPAAFVVAGGVTLLGVVGWGLVIPKIKAVDWD